MSLAENKTALKPIIKGQCDIDQKGIATGYGNFCISTEKFQSISQNCFSFNFIQIGLNSDIEFGIESESNESIKFNFSKFLFLNRSSIINPQIPYDGIDISLRLIVDKSKLLIYVNDKLYENSYNVLALDFYFFVQVTNASDRPCILATSFHKLSDEYNAFFPKLISTFWNEQDTEMTESDYYIAFSENSNFFQILSEDLKPLPGTNFIYFEVTVLSNTAYDAPQPNYKIGFTSHEVNSTCDKTELAMPSFNFPANQISTKSNIVSVPTQITQGTVIGVGIDVGNSYFFTFDGAQTNPSGFTYKLHKHHYAFISALSVSCQFYINIGQKPFVFKKIQPMSGWPIYYPNYPSAWSKGLPPHPHILNLFCPSNFFLNAKFPTVAAAKLTDPCQYEATYLDIAFKNSGNEVISLGYGTKDFGLNQMVGWHEKCVGIHSDDGKYFFGNGSGDRLASPDLFLPGVTVMARIENRLISFIVSKTHFVNITSFPYDAYPVISVSNSPVFIVNFGESPYFNVVGNQNEPNCDLVEERNFTLFNKVVSKIDNCCLKAFELQIGDVIESRDRTFRGTVVGALNKRIYCNFGQYPGGFPLVETDPLDFKMTYQIIHRKSKLIWPILGINIISIDLSVGNFSTLYATEAGLAFYIGDVENSKNAHVFRPLIDLYNNENCIILSEMPANILKGHFGELTPNFTSNDSPRFLDIVKKKHSAVLVLGSKSHGEIVGWDGVKETEVIFNSKIIFRPLFTAATRRTKTQMGRLGIGLARGGRLYMNNFYGFAGNIQYQKNLTKKKYHLAGGGCKMPPILNFLCWSLNNSYKVEANKDEITKIQYRNEQNNEEIPMIVEKYTTDLSHDERKKCPLITQKAVLPDEDFYSPFK